MPPPVTEALLLLLLCLASVVGSLNCYEDLEGVTRPDDSSPVDVAKFKVTNCSAYTVGQVVKVGYSKTRTRLANQIRV